MSSTLQTTACVRGMEKVTSTHMFKIMGYSLDKHIGKGKFLESTIFDVEGNYWSIQYYPNGCLAAEDDDISIFICLKIKLECVKAQYNFTILD
ncbi:BTB/POZ and MATH domain-containing protein 3-like protein [Carex littledalei]|uniref:BTB/POZ and MATH domain-containing protein 3-like protein n=1 Tax=Carex littledalei TaxID=544730 RepID=A0A833VCQ4_9POAL|nr:BTB/POZ and MATH domain-containing protein 3-like protein [Carex littledalei]